jgi:hypothetical protein
LRLEIGQLNRPPQVPEDRGTMRRVPRPGFAGCVVAALAVPWVCGCADNESSLFVRSVMKNSPPECTVQSDPTAVMLLGGTMDVALTDTYRAALLIGNQLVRRGSRDNLRTETARIALKGAEVRLQNSGGQQLSNGAFTVGGTGFVDPGSGDEPGYGVMFVPLVPPSVQPQAGTVITARVKVFGDTLGGTEITSNELSFPIAVCYGCLVDFPPAADDATVTGYQCNNASTGTSASTAPSADTAPCWMGQDDPVDCRFCVNTLPDVCTSPSGG